MNPALSRSVRGSSESPSKESLVGSPVKEELGEEASKTTPIVEGAANSGVSMKEKVTTSGSSNNMEGGKPEGATVAEDSDSTQANAQESRHTKDDEIDSEVGSKLQSKESRDSEPSDTDEEPMEIDEGEEKTVNDEASRLEPSGGEEAAERREEKGEEAMVEKVKKNTAPLSSEPIRQRRGSRVSSTPCSDRDAVESKLL